MTAAMLRALHRPGKPLVLPNAWDAASANRIAAAGFPAIATSSAAMAESLGYADHEQAPPGEIFDAVARIASAVDVPVSADLERGYRLGVAEFVERLAATGAVGCNVEDSDPATGELIDPQAQADFLAAIRQAAAAAGVDLVLNARVDVFLRGSGSPVRILADAIRRGRSYLAAGADCVFPIGAVEPAAIGELVAQTEGPVNILSGSGAPPLAELVGLGVARVTFGSGLFRSAYASLADQLVSIRTQIS
jgi:2-methylisocitrate lyase-like PEP mutase family enzyme